MPNIKSQKKRVALTAKQTARNKSARSALKTTVKKANASIEAGATDASAVVKQTAVQLNKAVNKGIVHRNTASRKISRLTKRANKVVVEAPEAEIAAE